MSRLPLVDPAAASGRVKVLFDGPLKGKHLNIFKAMANSPAALEAYLGMAGALAKASLSAKEQEVIHLFLSQANGCGYCLAAHTVIGKGAGLSEEQTVGARLGHLADPKLSALVRFVAAVHEKHGAVSDADLEVFKSAGYTDGHVAEVAAVYALGTYTNMFNIIAKTPVDFPPPPKA
ncbi:MAG: carboxymuconolactone decarboxylase family protein [Phycisphaeraceae bacterium]|nr:carboxymuconolactone decarboxylase family protein [Phycisphaeraceae bacterium]